MLLTVNNSIIVSLFFSKFAEIIAINKIFLYLERSKLNRSLHIDFTLGNVQSSCSNRKTKMYKLRTPSKKLHIITTRSSNVSLESYIVL